MSYNSGSNCARNFKSALRFALGRFEITGPITPWIVLQSVQLLLLIRDRSIVCLESFIINFCFPITDWRGTGSLTVSNPAPLPDLYCHRSHDQSQTVWKRSGSHFNLTFNKTIEVSTEYGKKVEVLENENRTEIIRIFKVFTVHKSKPSKNNIKHLFYVPILWLFEGITD